MKEIADFLERLDAYFVGKSPTERMAIIALPAVVVGYLAWALLNPSAEAAHEKSIIDKKNIEKKLAEDKNYLKSITRNGDREYLIKDLDKKISLAKKQSDKYHQKITILDKNLYKLSDLLFNNKTLSLFLDSITAKALENGVSINQIDNIDVDNNASFGHVLEVGIKCKGDFKGIVGFMNDLEQNTLVTDIFQSKIYTDENSTLVSADLNISVWGVNH